MEGKTKEDVEKLLGRKMDKTEQHIFEICKDDPNYVFKKDERGNLMADRYSKK